MEVLIVLLIFGVITALIANGKGRGAGGWFVAGILFGPFAVLAVLLATPGRQCPQCRKHIHQDAMRCPYCQSDLSAEVRLMQMARAERDARRWQ